MRNGQAACACAGVGDDSGPHKRSAKGRKAVQPPRAGPGEKARPAARPGAPALLRVGPATRSPGSEAARKALGAVRTGVRAFPPGERVGSFRGEQELGGKKSHKEICLPPCKMAAFAHLSGGGSGPGQGAGSCPGSARWPEQAGEKGTLTPPRLPGRPSACSAVPCLPPPKACQSPTPRQQPLDTDPCLQTQPGGGVGRPERGLAGRGRRPAPEDAPSREGRGVGARERARQLERTERLVFETVNSLNPYCEGFMQNISGLLK